MAEKPLSNYALDQLRFLLMGPKPKLEINNGCVDRLTRDGLIRSITRPSPYKVDLGKPRDFVEITDAGKALVRP